MFEKNTTENNFIKRIDPYLMGIKNVDKMSGGSAIKYELPIGRVYAQFYPDSVMITAIRCPNNVLNKLEGLIK